MKYLPFWIVSWAASAVLFGALQGPHLLSAVNVFAWLQCVLCVIATTVNICSKTAREESKTKWKAQPIFRQFVIAANSLAFLAGLAYQGWIVMFGVSLVCWLLSVSILSSE